MTYLVPKKLLIQNIKMSEIKAQLKEAINASYEFLLSLEGQHFLTKGKEIDEVLRQHWLEIKQLSNKYKQLLEKHKKLQVLRLQKEESRQKSQTFLKSLQELKQRLNKATPKIDTEKLNALDIVYLARQCPFTLHSFPNENIIQQSVLRKVPFKEKRVLPQPTIHSDGKKTSEITVTPPTEYASKRDIFINYTTDRSIPTSVNGRCFDMRNPPKIEDKNIEVKAVLCKMGYFDSAISLRDYIVDVNDTSLVNKPNYQPVQSTSGMVRPTAEPECGPLKVIDTPSYVETPHRPPSTNPFMNLSQISMIIQQNMNTEKKNE
jgi:hypothetical protein